MSYDIKPVAKALGLVSGLIVQHHKDLVPEGAESIRQEEFDVTLVWFAYILGGYKALVFCPQMPARYFEVTYNVAKKEHYIDTYQKVHNIAVADDHLTAPLN